MTKRWAVLVVVATIVTTMGLAVVPGSATTRDATSDASFLKSAINDIQSFWASEFPQVYGSPYKPLGQVIPAGPTTQIPACQGQRISYAKEVKGNAFYCFKSNYIVYDNQALFPALAKHFGPFALALVLAHEWGHAIQDRAGIDRSSAPPVYIELQADCFAGSWAKHIADGQSKAIKFAPGDLDTALAAYLTFRDPVGNAPDDPQSHGDAFDRTNAFQTGFDGGAPACKPLLASPPPVTETQFTSAQDAATGGNLPAAQVIPVTMELLDEYYAQVTPTVPPLTVDKVFKFNSSGTTSQFPKCGGKTLAKKDIQNRVFFCLSDNYIAFDEPLLNSIYNQIGDFGVASLIADTYATYVQYKTGFPGVQDNTVNAVLGADCDTGAWAQAIKQGLPSQTLNTIVTLAPGDLDKVIQAFIKYDAARGVGTKSDFVFRRVEAFRQGYFNGFASCAAFRNATSTPSG